MTRVYDKLLGLLLFFGLGILTLCIIFPFLNSLFLSSILVFATWPLYQKIRNFFKHRESLSSFIMTILLSFFLIFPLWFAFINLKGDLSSGLSFLKFFFVLLSDPNLVDHLNYYGFEKEIKPFLSDILSHKSLYLEKFSSYSESFLQIGLSIVSSLFSGILEISMSVFMAFFLYRSGDSLLESLRTGLRKITDRSDHFFDVVYGSMTGVIYGVLGTALAQGFLAFLGFYIAGVPGSFLFGFLIFFASIIPMAPPLIWLPVTLLYGFSGEFGWGVFLMIWGTFVVSGVDNVLKPYLISKESSLPFLLVFLGALGGLMFFGFIGIFLGPTLLALSYSVFKDWTDSFVSKNSVSEMKLLEKDF